MAFLVVLAAGGCADTGNKSEPEVNVDSSDPCDHPVGLEQIKCAISGKQGFDREP